MKHKIWSRKWVVTDLWMLFSNQVLIIVSMEPCCNAFFSLTFNYKFFTSIFTHLVCLIHYLSPKLGHSFWLADFNHLQVWYECFESTEANICRMELAFQGHSHCAYLVVFRNKLNLLRASASNLTVLKHSCQNHQEDNVLTDLSQILLIMRWMIFSYCHRHYPILNPIRTCFFYRQPKFL